MPVSRPLTMDEKLEVAGKMFDLLMETDIFLQWVEQTKEQWETPMVRESGLGRAVRREGVPV